MTAKLESLQPVLMCSDIPVSLHFYARLGFALAFQDDPKDPKYAGIKRDGIELHLQWHSREDFAQGDRPTYRFRVQDVDGLHAELRANGTAGLKAPATTPWNTYEFHVQDPDRNGLQFYRPL